MNTAAFLHLNISIKFLEPSVSLWHELWKQ